MGPAWVRHPHLPAVCEGLAGDGAGAGAGCGRAAGFWPSVGPGWMDGGGWGEADTIALVSATRLLNA